MYKLKYCIFCMCLAASLCAEEPWGKDADLVLVQKCSTGSRSKPYCKTPFLGAFAEAAIAFHQKIISPCDGPRSHFIPCSSKYTLDAMRKHGFFQGMLMGCDRLMRENKEEWVYRITLDKEGNCVKFDPVP